MYESTYLNKSKLNKFLKGQPTKNTLYFFSNKSLNGNIL